MVRALRLALSVCLLCARLATGEWKIVSQSNQSSSAGSVQHRRLVMEENAAGQRATLELAIFSHRNATLRVIDHPNSSLADVMQQENCIAGVNGGYFDPQDQPVGLLISDGRIIAPLQKAKLLSGVVSVSDGRLQIQRSGEFSPKSKPTAARQCGPFLVERGKPVSGLNNTRSARRTLVASETNDRALIGYCSHVTLAELAAVLAIPELKVQRALNLDGGSSSAFWFRSADGITSIREQKTVRDYLGVVAR